VDTHPGNISIGCGIDRHILFLIRSNIKSHVPVAGAQLSKIGDDGRLIRHWPAKIVSSVNERLGVELM
jgi:hypothetical protein